MRIVAARPEDLSVYIDILEEIASWLESRGVNHVPVGAYRSVAGYLLDSIRRQETYFLCLDGEIAGTLRLLPEDRVVWPEITSDDAIYLYNLNVRRRWAGQGLGRRALDWVEARSAELGRSYVRLDCFADNEVLCRYYLDAGYVDRGIIDAEYSEPFGVFRLRRFEKRIW